MKRDRVFSVASKGRQDLLEEELAAGNIKGQTLAVTTGIIMDKVLKLLEIDRKPGNNLNAQNIQINFISEERPKELPVEVIRDKGDSPSS